MITSRSRGWAAIQFTPLHCSSSSTWRAWSLACFAIALGGGSLLAALQFDSAQVLQAGKVWQLATYAFVHSPSGLIWFAIEMYMLYVFGREVERFVGRRAFIGLYARASHVTLATSYRLGSATANRHGGLFRTALRTFRRFRDDLPKRRAVSPRDGEMGSVDFSRCLYAATTRLTTSGRRWRCFGLSGVSFCSDFASVGSIVSGIILNRLGSGRNFTLFRKQARVG